MSPFDPLSAPFVSLSPAQLGVKHEGVRRCDLRGSLASRPRLAIVGSRAAHRHLLALLAPLQHRAMLRGWSLISGGALGIDAGAHRAALGLSMPQLAVLPCGRDRVYPRQHTRLFGDMLRSGAAGLLFAHPPMTPTKREFFAARNDIIINLADAVLVVEAGLRSGSRGTGERSLARGRATAVIAGSPGNAALIGRGAQVLPEPLRGLGPVAQAPTLEAFEHWLDSLDGPRAETHRPPLDPWPAPLHGLREALRAAGPCGASLNQLGPGAALALLEAELLGLVFEAAPGRWVSR